MNGSEDICVLVAAFEASGTIARCVRSALRQPEVAEVVVVDDASHDRTAALAGQAADGDRRLKVLRLEANGGPSAARNVAIATSKAPLLCVLDADDWMTDGRFTRLLAVGDDWDLLADDLLTADEARPLQAGPALLGVTAERAVSAKDFVWSNISRPDHPRRELGYLKPLMRRSMLREAGLRYDETLRLGEDYILYAEAMIAGARLRLAPACGYVAVRREGSLSHVHGAAELAALADADMRLLTQAHEHAPEVVPALRAHRRATLMKRDFRRALDAKASGDLPGALRHVLRTPATAAYIAGELWRARVAGAARP